MDVVDTQPGVTAEGARGAAPDERGSALGAVAIFLLTVTCHLPLLGGAPLGGTEGHRVFPSLGMVRTGDWILPRLYGQLYLIKPPLHDWMIALAQILSGNHGNEFVWRLPSVIGAGLLNAALYLFGTRWFGRVGGIVSGIAGLALLALWGQARTADVDGTNTLACTIASLCLIELLFGGGTQPGAAVPHNPLPSPLAGSRPIRSLPPEYRGREKYSQLRWGWIFTGGIAFGATLMTKGPAGLPLILGVIGWAAWSGRREGFRRLRSAGLWGPLLIGVALFGAYAVAAKIAISRLHVPPDYSGFDEVGKTLVPNNLKRVGQSLLVPMEVFAFALPVSLAMPLVFLPGIKSAIRESDRETGVPRSRIVTALAASILISWGVCLLTGMINPRYGYVTIAPLALLAGAVAAGVPFMSLPDASLVRAVALGCVVAMAGANWFIAHMAWKGGRGHAAMLAAGATATLLAIGVFVRLRASPTFRPAWGMVPLLVLLAVPFAYQFRWERWTHSGYAAAPIMRAAVASKPDSPILTGAVLRSIPEMFWYAGLHPQNVPTFHLLDPSQYPGGQWVVIGRSPDDSVEYERWSHEFGRGGLTHVTHFFSNKSGIYVGWYEGAEVKPTTTRPDTRPAGRAAEQGR
ncbi:MAG TPA: glycosyltransferase family 39 protein [Tepidisphaeraceae bacterium]|jgi:4-amino-4-deoxy-L-arabinose transferase-like glycosyltransferase